MIAASYKENPKVQFLPGQSADWWAYHKAPVSYRKEDRRKPSRWHRKVLARTTDRLRMLETLCQQCNVRYLEERLRTPGGTRRLLRELRRHVPCQVA